MIGSTLGHYRILEELGRGGMGVVYLAEDTKLKRRVALKLLPPELARDQARLARLKREAEALAALTHPNIVTIYSIEEVDGETFITMEYVEGQTLRERIPPEGLALDEFLKVAVPLAEAVGAAHERDIIHRDLKPANVLVASDGRVKVLDFGLARLSIASSDEAPTQSWATGPDVVVGTAPYMSPEQIKGLSLDARSDVFALGAVFYEMLSGQRPFAGNSRAEISAAILERQPQSLAGLGHDVPKALAGIVARCLEKQPDDRFAMVRDLVEALESFAASRSGVGSRRGRVAAVAAGVILLALATWQWRSAEGRVRARSALAEIEAHLAERRYFEAFHSARAVAEVIPEDPRLAQLLADASLAFNVTTKPPGARVSYRLYGDADGEWVGMGTSPIVEMPVPAWTNLHWKIEAPGFRTWEGERGTYSSSMSVDLVPDDSPDGMLRIPAGSVDLAGQSRRVPAFWLDRLEVTNREFAAFVIAGGYAAADSWARALEANQATLADLVPKLTDRAGRPGPAEWRLGSFPDGQGDHPVTGVSWYEAAAYCEFAGKTLPTLYHWRRATGTVLEDDMLLVSNFSGDGAAPAGSYAGIGAFGTLDMAGNVKEWTWNATGTDRHVAGGAWNEPEYLFHTEDHLPPRERSDAVGFRCAILDEPPDEELLEPIDLTYYDFSEEEPVSDDVFEALIGAYSYDPVSPDGQTEGVDESDPRWRIENVTFEMGPGLERLSARVYLPRHASPPYQTIIYFPASSALGLTSSERLAEAAFYDFLPASGRAFVYPIYTGTYERGGGTPLPSGRAGWRDNVVTWTREVRRVVDYLTERDDVDDQRLALFGLSLGGIYAPIFGAIDPRFDAIVIFGGGVSLQHTRDAPEVNPINFAPRLLTPTLMIAGKNDVLRPPDSGQRPLFELFGAPPDDKRFVVLEGGHVPNWNDIIRETLDWLDRYLGPVGPPTG